MGNGNGNGDGFGGLHRAIQSVAAEMMEHTVGNVTLERCGASVRVSMRFVLSGPGKGVSADEWRQCLPPGLLAGSAAEVQ